MSYQVDTDVKETLHVEDGLAQHHVDVRDAGADGHVATDEKGHSLVEINKAASARLAWKFDLRIIPVVSLLYLWCFIDRANIGNARLAGLEKDLKMKGNDYNILLSVFFVSYILFEMPANILTKVVGPGKMIPIYTFLFGLFSFAFAFCKTFGAALGVRFLLGVAEAGMLPGIAYYMSRWYTKDELVFRLALYIVMAPLAGAFGGLLASGILKIHGIGSLHTWQQIFFIEGLITMGIAIIAYMLLTDRPETAKWLTEEEKALASARVKSENAGQTVVVDKLSGKALKQGILVPSTLAIALIFLLNNITVQAVAIFTPTIVKTIYPHKTTIQLQLQTVPPYIVGALFVLLFPYLAWKTKRRGLYMLISAPLMVIGYIVFVATENPHARYAATFIIMSGAFSFGALCNGWAAINVASDSSRASAIGMVTMCGNIGALISTWTFLPGDAPNYIKANSINIGTGSGIIVIAALLLVWMMRENKKRNSGRYDYRLDGLSTDEIATLGNDHPGFRYRY